MEPWLAKMSFKQKHVPIQNHYLIPLVVVVSTTDLSLSIPFLAFFQDNKEANLTFPPLLNILQREKEVCMCVQGEHLLHPQKEKASHSMK